MTTRARGIEGASTLKITADSARPETINHLKERGFNIVPALKGPGSVEDGIEFHKSYDLVVHPRCAHLVDELIHYSWAVDRQSGEILNKLADVHNHVIDALRYALEGARKGQSRPFSSSSTGPSEFHRALDNFTSGLGGRRGWLV